MAPQAGIDFRFVTLTLIVRIEWFVPLLDVALETEHDPIGHLAATQPIGAGW